MNIDKLLALSLVFFVTTGLFCFEPVKSEYNGYTSYSINSDGTVSPSSAPILQKSNTYTLSGDIQGTIAVQRSNTILDGNGFSVSGGLKVNNVSNVTIENFIVLGGAEYGSIVGIVGILLDSTTNILVANNTISGVWGIQAMNAVPFTGLVVQGGSSNVISGNIFKNNIQGLSFYNSINNLIMRNTLTCGTNSWNLYSSVGGMFFANASNNAIYSNNFNVSVGSQAGDINSVNVWDNGYPSGGNYWSDYHSKYPRSQMIGDSGIGNVSYVIDSQNKDNYPLLSPFDFNLFLYRTTKPEIQVLSAENQTYSSNNVAFNYTVDKATSWIGYSLDNKDNVTVTGNFTIANMTNGMHSIAIYANDTFGNMGVQTSNFNVNLINSTAKTFPITTQMLVIITIVAVIAVIVTSLLLFVKHRKTSQENLTKRSFSLVKKV